MQLVSSSIWAEKNIDTKEMGEDGEPENVEQR